MPLDSLFSTSWERDKPELVGPEPYDVRVVFVKSDFSKNLWLGVNIVPFNQWARKYGKAYGYNPDGTRMEDGDKGKKAR